MKIIINFILAFSPLFLFAQTISFDINGVVNDTNHVKYAYLTTLSQQIPISSDKIFMSTPIIDGKFNFKGVFDLNGKDYQHACIFLDDRGNISKEEVKSKFKQLIWVAGREKNMRIIILENIDIKIAQKDQVINSEIISGGFFTIQKDKESIAVRNGNREMIEFIKKYSDSPVALEAVESITNLTIDSNKDKLESMLGTPSELYNLLSVKLRTSKRGLVLKKKIDEKKKL